MNFRTILPPLKEQGWCTPKRPVALLGSCFAHNIGLKMRESLWTAINPFGTLYNPLSIKKTIDLSLFSEESDKIFSASLFSYDGLIHSHFFDSKFSAYEQKDCIRNFMQKREIFEKILSEGETIFVTFGTSWVYRLLNGTGSEIGQIVANCHKQPAKYFTRVRLQVKEIAEEWEVLLKNLKNRYQNLKVIFTVSPVRHLKDGFMENSRSKAILLLAIEELCLKFDFCRYFPAYEILNDDLRDYRFYAEDLTHPSEEACEYIWELFCESFLTVEDKVLLKDGLAIRKGVLHRSLPNASSETPLFVKKREGDRMEKLKSDYLRLKAKNPKALDPFYKE